MFVCLVLVSNMVGGVKFHTLNACFTIIPNPMNISCLQFSNHIHYLCFSIQLAQNFFLERKRKERPSRKRDASMKTTSTTSAVPSTGWSTRSPILYRKINSCRKRTGTPIGSSKFRGSTTILRSILQNLIRKKSLKNP